MHYLDRAGDPERAQAIAGAIQGLPLQTYPPTRTIEPIQRDLQKSLTTQAPNRVREPPSLFPAKR
jgi:hypothetical protein